jgi:nitrate/TMAO reductase-like tetraheme cytochrome c subunit
MNAKFKKRLTIAVLAVGGLIILTISSMQWTSRSEFCNNCHYMEPFYRAWQHSAHNDVDCVICHYEPGMASKIRGKLAGLEQLFKYATRSYLRSKPWAEISDASCLRSGCHDQRLLKGKTEFKEGIIFDHTPHLNQLRRGKELRCTSCHSQVVQGEHITVTASTCFLCHFKGRDAEASPNCIQCHDAPVATLETQVSYDHTVIVDRGVECQKCHGQMVVGDGAVPMDNCEDCHFEKEFLEQYGDTEKMHNIHISQHKIDCQRCHLQIQHKSVSRSQDVKPDCNSCHLENHQTQEMLFRGQGGRGVADHPSPMYSGGLNCQGCHIFHQSSPGFEAGGESVVARRESCEPCHGPGYSDLVEAWKDSTEKRLRIIESSLERVDSELNGIDSTTAAGSQAWQALENARYNYQLVQYGKSVHNITYADRLLQQARHSLTMALDMAGSRYRLPPYPWTGQVVPGECASCHEGIARSKIKTSDGLLFSHGTHLNADSLSCRDCHSNMRSHGELVMPRENCLSCHHEQQALTQGIACESCHAAQLKLYSGRSLDAGMPDVMFEAELECGQCHFGDSGEIVRPEADVCVTCHDEEYAEILAEWTQETAGLLARLDKLLAAAQELNLTTGQQGNLASARRIRKVFADDGSRGVHNYMMAVQYLEEAAAKLEEFLPEN